MSDREFDDLIRKKVSEKHFTFKESYWQDAEGLIEQNAQRKRRRKFFFLFFAMFGLLAVSSGGSWWIYQNSNITSNGQSTLADAQEVEEAVDANMKSGLAKTEASSLNDASSKGQLILNSELESQSQSELSDSKLIVSGTDLTSKENGIDDSRSAIVKNNSDEVYSSNRAGSTTRAGLNLEDQNINGESLSAKSSDLSAGQNAGATKGLNQGQANSRLNKSQDLETSHASTEQTESGAELESRRGTSDEQDLQLNKSKTDLSPDAETNLNPKKTDLADGGKSGVAQAKQTLDASNNSSNSDNKVSESIDKTSRGEVNRESDPNRSIVEAKGSSEEVLSENNNQASGAEMDKRDFKNSEKLNIKDGADLASENVSKSNSLAKAEMETEEAKSSAQASEAAGKKAQSAFVKALKSTSTGIASGLSLSLGVRALENWDSKSGAYTIGPSIGILSLNDIGKRWTFETGLIYSIRSGAGTETITRNVEFDFGFQEVTTTYETRSLNYFEIPFRLGYYLNEERSHLLAVGATFLQLASANNQVTTIRESSLETPVESQNRELFKADGYSSQDVALSLLYSYRLNQKLALSMQYRLGMNDNTSNAFFLSSMDDRNTGLIISLRYSPFNR